MDPDTDGPDHWDDQDSDLDAFDFSPLPDAEGPGFDGMPDDDFDIPVNEDEDPVDALTAIDSPSTQQDDTVVPVASARNPADSVIVTTHLNGSIVQVDLDSRVTEMTESQLAEQIRAVAEVATKRASAVVHIAMVNILVGQGMSFPEARSFAETMLPFTTPREADAAGLDLAARFGQGDS
jgi:hypothetical protein